MKKLATTLCALALCAFVTSAAFAAASNIRISQVYGGGGGSAGTYIKDYVEIFNPTGSPVNISGWSLQYGSAAGTSFGSTAGNMFVFPANTTIQPCKYILVETSSPGTGGAPLPVTADFSTVNMSMSATAGKVALVTNSVGANLCAGNTTGGIYADVVGFGSANCYETAPTGTLSNTQAAVRLNGGMLDTENNSTNFSIVSNPVPHNSASPANVACLATPASRSTWGQVKSIYR